MISKTKINFRVKNKNLELKRVIFALKKNKEYLELAKYLSRPKRKHIAVNLDKINKYAKENETIVVPGKILSKGNLNHKISLVAYKISNSAQEKIKSSGSTFKDFNNFVKSKETKFKIII